MSQVTEMTEREVVAFLLRAFKASACDQLERCEHGHVECSDRQGGPCLDEALALPAGQRWCER